MSLYESYLTNTAKLWEYTHCKMEINNKFNKVIECNRYVSFKLARF